MSRKPLRKPLLERGRTIFLSRYMKPAPLILPASSSSVEICSMFAEPERLENGMFLTIDTRKSSA